MSVKTAAPNRVLAIDGLRVESGANGAWGSMPDWCQFLLKLGFRCGSRPPLGPRSVLIGLAMPTSRYAATWITAGAVLGRFAAQERARDKQAANRFSLLRQSQPGQTIRLVVGKEWQFGTFLSGDKDRLVVRSSLHRHKSLTHVLTPGNCLRAFPSLTARKQSLSIPPPSEFLTSFLGGNAASSFIAESDVGVVLCDGDDVASTDVEQGLVIGLVVAGEDRIRKGRLGELLRLGSSTDPEALRALRWRDGDPLAPDNNSQDWQTVVVDAAQANLSDVLAQDRSSSIMRNMVVVFDRSRQPAYLRRSSETWSLKELGTGEQSHRAFLGAAQAPGAQSISILGAPQGIELLAVRL